MGETVHVVELVGMIVGLLMVAAVTLAVADRVKLPFTVMLVLVGMGLAQAAHHGPAWLGRLTEHDIQPDVILFVFLPTLIFESAFNLDPRRLRDNLLPILVLAIPGLLLSTALIGLFVSATSSFGLPVALLLGAILSATDPVAVVALFRQLGAPPRLTVLVEGESLFNDATSLVLASILTGVVLAGRVAPEDALAGLGEFLVVFAGGVATGWLLAVLTGFVLGRVEENPAIEISLTTVLAYMSFVVAEEVFHVSGVMACVAAGVTIGGWGRTKISPSVARYLEHFWEYLAFVANALIFLLVGLRTNIAELFASIETLPWVVIGMIGSRAVVVYGLVPVVGRLPNSRPINGRYQTVMFWGGLRGAVALAIVLALPEFPGRQELQALVMGAVLFSLLVNGLSIDMLVRGLGLDVPPLSDRLARAEGQLAAKRRAVARVPELQAGGLFSQRIARRLEERCQAGIGDARRELEDLKGKEMNREQERRLLFLRTAATGKAFFRELHGRGHLSEESYRDLVHSLEVLAETMRGTGRVSDASQGTRRHPFQAAFLALASGLRMPRLAERIRTWSIAREYEKTWGLHRGCLQVLSVLDELAEAEAVRSDVVDEVRRVHEGWRDASRERLDLTAEQFPEFVTEMQERLAERLLLHAEREAIEEQEHSGAIPHGVAERMLATLAAELRGLRGAAVARLAVDPSELLRTVPFFRNTPPEQFQRVATQLRQVTVPAGAAIITQGEAGDSLYLIGRGVVRVSRVAADGEETALATLMAGDFFGEMALLSAEPRSATCRAVTPAALWELKRADFDAAAATFPGLREAVQEEAERRRRI